MNALSKAISKSVDRVDDKANPLTIPAQEPAILKTPSPTTQVNGAGQASLMKTDEMVERGLLLGWTAIGIYKWAVPQDVRLLEALRERVE